MSRKQIARIGANADLLSDCLSDKVKDARRNELLDVEVQFLEDTEGRWDKIFQLLEEAK